MIVCDECKKNGVETEIEETGLPSVEVAVKEETVLIATLMVNEGEICSMEDSTHFAEEFEGDWCQACLQAKLRTYLKQG